MPWALRYSQGKTRVLLRRSLGDILPPEVAARTDKSFFDDVNSKTYLAILENWRPDSNSDIWAFADKKRFEAFSARACVDKTRVRAAFRLAALGTWMNHFDLGCIV
ncbi:MAG: asparagine synthase-related protein [Polyangiaceae bacterium]